MKYGRSNAKATELTESEPHQEVSDSEMLGASDVLED